MLSKEEKKTEKDDHLHIDGLNYSNNRYTNEESKYHDWDRSSYSKSVYNFLIRHNLSHSAQFWICLFKTDSKLLQGKNSRSLTHNLDLIIIFIMILIFLMILMEFKCNFLVLALFAKIYKIL